MSFRTRSSFQCAFSSAAFSFYCCHLQLLLLVVVVVVLLLHFLIAVVDPASYLLTASSFPLLTVPSRVPQHPYPPPRRGELRKNHQAQACSGSNSETTIMGHLKSRQRQSKRRKKKKTQEKAVIGTNGVLTVTTTTVPHHQGTPVVSNGEHNDDIVSSDSRRSIVVLRDENEGDGISDNDLAETMAQTATRPSFVRQRGEGNLPDVYWRSIPMEHLREHPRFVPLMESHTIRRLESLEEARVFRQDSWQWEVLHAGRCTTSHAVAALGFLENMAGEILQVPPRWRKGGRGAYQRLSHPSPLRTLEGMNRVLVVSLSSSRDSALKEEEEAPSSSRTAPELTLERHVRPDSRRKPYWTVLSKDREATDRNQTTACSMGRFVARYNYRLPPLELEMRKKVARQCLANSAASLSAVRMRWGNSQEATALLTALNYFAHNDPKFVMKEVGMCGAGLSLNASSPSLMVGASPDAVLCHGDGRIEALEVKNHCPFVTPFAKKGKSSSSSRPRKRFRIGDRPVMDSGVLAQYIPQLMLEMLCLGEACRSAVLVRQTATNGALLLRIHRDDEWISEMLHFLDRFQHEFVDQGRPPPPNFFFLGGNRAEVKRYRRFLNRTMEIRNRGVQVIAHIPPEYIQRAQHSDSPLFLDQ
jgi:hypothetical protein